MRLTFTQFIAIVSYSFIAHLDCISTLKRTAIRSQDKQDQGKPRWLPFALSMFHICFHSIDKHCHF